MLLLHYSARPHRRAAEALSFSDSHGTAGGILTLLVCSSCHAPLADGTTHCPHCGPGSLALLDTAHLPATPRLVEPERGRTLARALAIAEPILETLQHAHETDRAPSARRVSASVRPPQ